MKPFLNTNSQQPHRQRISNYYQFHAPIYDATRWSFLFGRRSLITAIPTLPANPHILEIGCGTGRNILHLKKRFPDAQITGLDLSKKMLSVAKNKMDDTPTISFKKHRYGSENLGNVGFDVILLSYSITMMKQNYEIILDQVRSDLKSGGIIAVVDFHTSPFRWFEQWMQMNYVDFSGDALPLLKQYFRPVTTHMRTAYLGLWRYYQFIGKLR